MRLALPAAFAALALAPAAAPALTVSPTGAYAVQAPTTTFSLPGLSRPIACQNTSLPVTFTASGFATSAAGGLAFSTCEWPAPLIAATVTQAAGWLVSMTLSASPATVSATISIPVRGLAIALASGCSFTVQGSITHTTAASLPLAIGPASAIPVAGGTLVVDSINGSVCSLAGINPGTPVTAAQSIGLSRTMTVSG